jgi:hypothetical protein
MTTNNETLLQSIAQILWQNGPDTEWSSDTTTAIADIIATARPDLYNSLQDCSGQEAKEAEESGDDLQLLTALDIIEGIEDSDVDQQIAAWQRMVDTGLVWKLQGWYARTAERLILQGLIQAA